MDITREEVASILGISAYANYGTEVSAQKLETARESKLWNYIEFHEERGNYFDSHGQPCILLNQRLVYLWRGAGFGELALMSDTARMSTCRANVDCILGTLNRKNFSNILRRSQKRKIQEQIQFLKGFSILRGLSSIKLQKISYLLEEKQLSRGVVVYEQG